MKQDYICVHPAGPRVGAIFLDKQPLAKRRSEWISTDGTRHWIHPYYFKHEVLIPYVVKKAYNIGDKVSIRPDSDHYEQSDVNPRCDVIGEVVGIDFRDTLPYQVVWSTGTKNIYAAEDLFLREEFKPQEIDLSTLYEKSPDNSITAGGVTLADMGSFITINAYKGGTTIDKTSLPNVIAALLEFM
jgi:hypothetical protein